MPTVTVRLPNAVIAGIDALAASREKSRTDIIREILKQALDAQPKAKKGK
jgi:predicted transcriptional regulator